MSEARQAVLEVALAAAVPLRICEMHAKGGPSDLDWTTAHDYGMVLGARGDVLQYGGKGKGGVEGEGKGSAAALFNRLAHALAVMSFCPGGVQIFGRRYEAEAYKEMARRWGR